MLVAWAKVSGLARIAPAITAFRQGGGTAEIILGIDANGGTWEGLELARTSFDSAFVFHDSGSRTFHPKVYLLSSDSKALAFVGSGNLTRGGLFTNYEATLMVEMVRANVEDESLFAEVSGYIDWFRLQKPSCQPLDDAALAALRSEAVALIQSEREQYKRSSSRRSRMVSSGTIFGGSIPSLGSAPAISVGGLAGDQEDDDSRIPTVSPTSPGSGSVAGPVGQASIVSPGFFKRLAPNDVSASSSPGQMVIPIAFIDFFPDLFLEKDESASGGPRQLGREIGTTFHDGVWSKAVLARVILYEPAANHPRPNIELRFTFRDSDVFSRLSAGDYLMFEQDQTGITVTRQPPGWRQERFDWL